MTGTRRAQTRISRRLRSPTYPKRCVHHALFSDRCILCLKARIRELTRQIDELKKARCDHCGETWYEFDGYEEEGLIA